MNENDIYKIFLDFVEDQVLVPGRRVDISRQRDWEPCARLLYRSMIRIVSDYREGL